MPSTRQAPSHLLIEVFFLATIISTIEGLLLINGAVIPLAVDLEQCFISGHAGHDSSSRPAQRGFWSRAAAVFGSRSQPAPRRVFAAVATCMVENFVYSFVWVLVGRVRLPGPKM